MIKINISNKVAYTLIFILILALAGVIVYAYTNPIPDKGHGGDKILAAVPFVSEKTLQTAITDGNFFAAREGKPSIIQYINTPYGNYNIGPHDACLLQSFENKCASDRARCRITQNPDRTWNVYRRPKSDCAEGTYCSVLCFDWMT